MSPETTETQNTEQTAATGNVLQDAVKIASDLLVVNRDQKNAAIVLAGMTAEERQPIQNFITKVHAQADASKNVYALIQAQAKVRKAGKPTRSRKKADTAAPVASAKK